MALFNYILYVMEQIESNVNVLSSLFVNIPVCNQTGKKSLLTKHILCRYLI